jgi:hypothetical protein
MASRLSNRHRATYGGMIDVNVFAIKACSTSTESVNDSTRMISDLRFTPVPVPWHRSVGLADFQDFETFSVGQVGVDAIQ